MNRAPYKAIASTALCVAVACLTVALRMSTATADLRRECALCAEAAADLAPYVEAARNYAMAKAVFEADASEPPAPRMGLPPAKVSTERPGEALDGWIPWFVTYSWDRLEAGQAFAALDSFTSRGGALRMHELRLEATADGVSLKVTLCGASRAAGGE